MLIKGCFHNWSDEHCISILHDPRPAMRPDYNGVLISERVVPGVVPGAQPTALGIIMHISPYRRSVDLPENYLRLM